MLSCAAALVLWEPRRETDALGVPGVGYRWRRR
jgi:hypothetical protein